MSEKLSIRERMMRQLIVVCKGIKQVQRVERYDQRGNTDDPFSVVIDVQTETAQDGALNNDGPTPNLSTTDIIYGVTIDLLILLTEDEQDPSDQIFSRFLARIREKMQADVRLTEADTSEKLADDVEYTGSLRLEREDNDAAMHVVAMYEITSDELTADPFRRPFMATAKTG